MVSESQYILQGREQGPVFFPTPSFHGDWNICIVDARANLKKDDSKLERLF